MSVYDRISKKIGLLNWQCNVFHDDGWTQSDGGGKSCMYLSPPGKGKTTLMVQAAQSTRSVIGDSKVVYIHKMNSGKGTDHFNIEPETVIWRIREFDSFCYLIPPNWMKSYPFWNTDLKPVHVFVHELDNPLFYSVDKNKPISPINFPPLERYHDAEDLMHKLHWNCVNAVLEPQTYRLSPNLVFALQKHKMEDDTTAAEPAERSNALGAPTRKIGRPKKTTDYSKKFVSPAYFWYDILDMAPRLNSRKHITIFIDEFHEVAEADCEGDAWKLVSILAQTYPQFRKNNVSLHLSTHQLSFVDYRIAKRIEYINWFRGAKLSQTNSMITLQSLLSNLEMGQLLTEEVNIQFGITTFDKVHNAPPQVYVHGLAGQYNALPAEDFKRLMEVQDNLEPPSYFKEKAKSILPEIIEI